MGKVTEELIALINKQLQDHGIVVWYDPEQAYTAIAKNLSLADTTVLCYNGSFFDLRYRMETLLEFVTVDGLIGPNPETPPHVIVYVPLDRAKAYQALIEAEAAGVVMEPGASPWQRNTRLKVLAERVFNRISPDRASSIAAEVEAGRRTLPELDWLADQTGELGSIKLVFGTTAVADVVLAFLNSEEHDEAIVKKEALPELASLCNTELGVSFGLDQTIGQARHQLCFRILLSELALKMSAAGGDASKFVAMSLPENSRHQEQLLSVCKQWRNRLDLRESYGAWAKRVETEAQIVMFGIQASHLLEVETFPYVESLLLEWAERRILDGVVADALKVAGRRKSSFWSLQDGEYMIRWTLVESAAQLLIELGRVEDELKSIRKDAGAIVDAYTEGISSAKDEPALPWSRVDRHHRHLEHRYAMLDLRSDGPDAQLEKLVSHVRCRYAGVIGQSAEQLAGALVSASFRTGGVLRQADVFKKLVQETATERKTAYILVDALRYEMAQELVEGLGDEYSIDLRPVIAQLPTVTEIGMAALMPRADKGMALVDAGGGKLGVAVGGTLLKDRASRIRYLESNVAGRPLALKLNDLMKPSRKRQQEITQADIVLVTSREIDRQGEEAEDEEEARRYMNEVLEKLRRGIRRLASLGVRHIVVTADHGYLCADELDDAMKIDPPGGHTVDLHPRVWVGHGGTAAPGFIRVKTTALGLAGDMDLAFPLGLACFRTRGASRGYFHGGVSLQELLIPAATISVREVRAPDIGTSKVILTLAKPKVTTRFFSVEARYVIAGLIAEDNRRVKVVVRSQEDQVGVVAMAAYGFEEGTQEILLEKDRPNAITLMLTSDVGARTLSVHVLDVTTQVELASIKNVLVEITI